jgi:hypothetical protein
VDAVVNHIEMECYVFTSEPVGSSYFQLLDYCCSVAAEVILVVRDPDMDPGDPIKRELAGLSQYLLGCDRAKEWPGTVLLSDEATVYRYRVSDDLCAHLKKQKTGLFQWIHPEAPEDLCFMRENGNAILVTISHERDAYLLLTADELHVIQSQFSMLGTILRKEGQDS